LQAPERAAVAGGLSSPPPTRTARSKLKYRDPPAGRVRLGARAWPVCPRLREWQGSATLQAAATEHSPSRLIPRAQLQVEAYAADFVALTKPRSDRREMIVSVPKQAPCAGREYSARNLKTQNLTAHLRNCSVQVRSVEGLVVQDQVPRQVNFIPADAKPAARATC
jgi:hypothetical protein